MSWHVLYPAAAAAAVRRSASVRVATARSGFFSLVTYLRTCRRCSSGPPDRWWSVDIFAAERHIQKKEKRKYGSLCLDAHKFRTPLVLRYMVLLHSTHTTNLHYTTCLYLLHTTTTATKMPYVSNPGCLFFLQCRALTRDIRYTLPP